MDLEKKIQVAVDGASGYLGSHLVHLLLQEGMQVRAIVHEGARDADLAFLRDSGAQVYKCNLDLQGSPDKKEELVKALSGIDAVVHLIGSIAPKKGESLSGLHGGQMQALLSALPDKGTKVILVTALGSTETAANQYHASKWQSEEILKKSSHPYLILQPSLIIGRQVGRRDSKLIARYIKIIQSRPRVPLVGGGKNLVQPIFVGDLCRAIAAGIKDTGLQGETLELGGPEQISMHDLVMSLMDNLKIKKPLLSIPFALATGFASILELVQDQPLLSRTQVELSKSNNVCKQNSLQNRFGIEAVSVNQALATYSRDVAASTARAQDLSN